MDLFTQVLTVLFGYVTLFYEVRGFHNDPKCGQNRYRDGKIVGGESLSIGEHPWFISIKETGQHECGGFIISNKAVLTAAHCFKHFSEGAAASPKTISVTLAPHYQNEKSDNQSSKYTKWESDVKVKRIIRHPNYDAQSETGKFDIAILLLEEKIEWNIGTRPVCLPITNTHQNPRRKYTNPKENLTSSVDFKNGDLAIVVGWASLSHLNKSEEYNDTLQKVSLTLYSNEECRKILREKNVSIEVDMIDSSIICAGSNDEGFDSCSGDSGSALLVQRGKIFTAIGIVSSGYGKCGGGIPGLYTNIKNFLWWIDLYSDQIENSPFLLQNFASIVPDNIIAHEKDNK